MQIEWVIFDAVGTVMYPTPKVGRVYFEIAKKHGSQLSEIEIAIRFGKAFETSEQADLGTTSSLLVKPTNEQREYDRWQQIVREVVVDLQDTTECFTELFQHFGKPQAWAVFGDVADTFASLNSRGTKLAIASNFDRRLHPVLDGHPEFESVTTRFVSSEIGFRKPSEAFYSHIIDACQVQADQIIMVGDGLANDIEGALAVGMHAVHIDRAADDISIQVSQSTGSDYHRVSSLRQIGALFS